MRVSFVELSDGFGAEDRIWDKLGNALVANNADVLVTNKMPFGRWCPSSPRFDT